MKRQLDPFINTKIQVGYFKSAKVCILKTFSKVTYFLMPREVFFEKTTQTSYFLKSEDPLSIKTFFETFSLLRAGFHRYFRKLVILKGLGLKVYQRHHHLLWFKLGYSHKIYLKLKPKMKARITKKDSFLFLTAINEFILGNFIYKIKKLKFPNIYTGKGVWFQREKILLKEVKKSAK